jgi:hypothetical protein
MTTRLRLSRRVVFLLLGLVVVLVAVEGVRFFRFYDDLQTSRDSLLSLKSDLDLTSLDEPADEVEAKRARLQDAQRHLDKAQSFASSDPLLFIAGNLPVIGKQVDGLQTAVEAGHEAAGTGIAASDVALAYSDLERDPSVTSVEQAVGFLVDQQAPMSQVTDGYNRMSDLEADLPEGLWGPLASAKDDLGDALDKLDGLVDGYNQAQQLLPELLGYSSQRSYLLLPQNNTELFPSGGLISSYGIVTFDKGRLVSVNLEYFGKLYERWQRESGGEYIEPPTPLKTYLLGGLSFALGEAGWWPDFPTTAGLAQDFVQKGGAPATDGTIAIDLEFISGLLELLGPVDVPGYDVTVNAQNLSEVALELSRDDDYQPGEPHEAFLSHLSAALLEGLYSMPKDHWLDLLEFLGRMGRERHLQLNFSNPQTQALSQQYGFDGAMLDTGDSDYLMVADTSVRSTKLNLIMQPKISLDVALSADGSARSTVTYDLSNPLPRWEQGRDPELVRKLMLTGTYGCYLRYYLGKGAQLVTLSIDGQPASLEQLDEEFDRTVVGHFFPVNPGAARSSQIVYDTPNVVQESDGQYTYRLVIQKEAGTDATPLVIHPIVPSGATITEVQLDGQKVLVDAVNTDLQQDRVLEVSFVKNS